MTEVHVWGATGTDPRIEGKQLRMYFGFPATEFHVLATLNHFLGYMPFVDDRFPMSNPISDVFEHDVDDDAILSDDLRVQMKGFEEAIIPAGTRVRLIFHYELLFSAPHD